MFTQARDIGVLQVHLSGGEPLARPDLPEIVSHVSGLGCYVNLVTSGLGLTEARLADLVERGLDNVQLSVQGADAARGDRLAGAKAHHHKIAAAALVRKHGLPLTVNAVLHRANHDQVAGFIDLATSMGADRLELANTQYYGWALRNREALMPTREQLAAAEPVVRAAMERLKGTMEIVYVLADYYEPYPKPCMHGWGAIQLTVAPDGSVLPCPARPARSPPWNSTTSPRSRCPRSGTTPAPSTPTAARSGCPTSAVAATGAPSTTGAAAARPSCSPGTPRPPTRSARARTGEAPWTCCWRASRRTLPSS